MTRLLALVLALTFASAGQAVRPRTLDLQLLSASAWQGQIDPVHVGTGDVGGAAALSAYWQADRKRAPGLTLMTGGSFGVSDPLSGQFQDVPAILAMNLMGVQADTLGNHSFNHGLEPLQRLIDLSRASFVSANLEHLQGNLTSVRPYRLFTVNGVRVAVIGVTNPDTPAVLKPGYLGTIRVTGAVKAALAARKAAERQGATVFVGLVHLGINAVDPKTGRPSGPLIDFANRVRGFDAILGEGGDLAVKTVRNGALVVQNRLRGVTYSRTLLRCNPRTRRVVARSAEFVTPLVSGVTPDPDVAAVMAPYRAELVQRLEDVSGVATQAFPDDPNGWTQETAIGDLVTDAMRASAGADFAVMNSGAIRDGLPSRYQPADRDLRRPQSEYADGPPFDLVGGDFYSLLPFNNFLVTRSITGAQVHAMLEHSLSLLPQASGRFLQVSGLRFTYDPSRPVGSRLVAVTRENGTPIPADGTRYTLALNEYMNAGGDGYTLFADGSGITGDSLPEAVRQYVAGHSPVAPGAGGRIVAVGGFD